MSDKAKQERLIKKIQRHIGQISIDYIKQDLQSQLDKASTPYDFEKYCYDTVYNLTGQLMLDNVNEDIIEKLATLIGDDKKESFMDEANRLFNNAWYRTVFGLLSGVVLVGTLGFAVIRRSHLSDVSADNNGLVNKSNEYFAKGYAYYSEKNFIEAVKWCQKGADAGSAAAMNLLGTLYEDGKGVEQNFKIAAFWYQKSADAGHPSGMNNLGFAYEFGQGVEKNLEISAEWFRKSANAGFVKAMFSLAVIYDKGIGVQQDLEAAIYWYQKVSDLGCVKSMINLGFMFETGSGVKRDDKKAIELYIKAADRGHPYAENRLRELGIK